LAVQLVLLGAPGSGKGTQGANLADHFAVPHISSGDLLRKHVAGGTDLGQSIAAYLERGEFVPDELVLAVVGDAVVTATQQGGYILDGFPRTRAQAERAYELAGPAGAAADAVVYLAVPDDVARRRLTERSDDSRADDVDPAVIERRLQLFHDETEPLLAYYADRGILVPIDAEQPPNAVSRAIFAALAAR
jgi:adenylate kinase